MTQEALDAVIAAHALWLANPLTGAQANLAGQDCTGLDFRRANLTDAQCEALVAPVANLRNVNLTGADLEDAVFIGADLYRLIAQNATAPNANFQETQAIFADFRFAALAGAEFGGASLLRADFRNADVTDAIFRGTDLRRTDFTGAVLLNNDFCKAVVAESEGLNFMSISRPAPVGSFDYAIYDIGTGLLNIGCTTGTLVAIHDLAVLTYDPADPDMITLTDTVISLCQQANVHPI